MSSKWILSLLIAAVVGWTQVACMMPEEGTIIYDQDYPELPTDNIGVSGSGSARAAAPCHNKGFY